MLYTYNKNAIQFRKLKLKNYLIILIPIVIILIFTGYFISSAGNHPNPIEKLVYKDNPPVFLTAPQFTEELLVKKLKQLKVKFPHIVVAQARQESNNYASDIFLENNNLFGMKMAGARPSTAIRMNRNHALYNNWEDSVIDYAFYQTTYLKNIKSETQYLNYLNNHYAADSLYHVNIKRHLSETKLLFNNLK